MLAAAVTVPVVVVADEMFDALLDEPGLSER